MAKSFRKAPDVNVRIDGQLFADAYPEGSAARSIGSRSVDEVSISIRPAIALAARDPLQAKIQDLQPVGLFDNSEVEVSVVSRNGNERVVHWGKVAKNTYLGDEDRIVLTSRLDPHLTSFPMVNRVEWKRSETGDDIDGPGSRLVLTDLPVVMNPEVDGQAVPNMYLHNGQPYFIDTESLTRNEAPPLQVHFWSLGDAVQYFLRTLNPPGQNRYITNPGINLLRQTLGQDPTLIRDLRFKYGSLLPEIFDQLLTPLGRIWWIDLFRGQRTFQFIARKDSVNTDLKLQRYGEDVDWEKSEVRSLNNISFEAVSESANNIRILGALKEYESTFELVPAWKPEHDTLNPSDLSTEEREADPTKARVWTDWVLNEAGDYNGLRPGINKAFDFSNIFNDQVGINWTRRRRKFLPTITTNPDGTPIGEWRGISIDYKNVDGDWKPLSELGVDSNIQILDRECGIRFVGVSGIPFSLYAIAATQGGTLSADNVSIRVTASVQSDVRLDAIGSSGISHLDDPLWHTIDMSKSFQFAQVYQDSKYFAEVQANNKTSRQVDDTALIQQAANDQEAAWNTGYLRGAIELGGIDMDRSFLGRSIRQIIPRNIDMRTSRRSVRFPVVVSERYDFVGQRTMLTLETFRDA